MAQDSKNLLLSFDKFIVFYNPVSTNSRRSGKRIAELRELFPSKKVEVIETSSEGPEANKRLVVTKAKNFDSKTVICIASGDGTVSAVLEALMTSPQISTKARKVPVLPLWGGNANDLAHMINGLSHKTSLRKIFEQGAIVPIYPINVEFKTRQQIESRVAACYVSFGASAFAAQQTELPKNKKKKIHVVPGVRMVNEMAVVAKSLIKSKPFTIEANDETLPVYERIFVNGSRIAKIDRLPVRLNQKAFYEATLSHKHPKALLSLLSALKILKNRTYGEVTEKDISFVLNNDTWAQIDGEVLKLPKNTQVKVSLSKIPFYVISTKLA